MATASTRLTAPDGEERMQTTRQGPALSKRKMRNKVARDPKDLYNRCDLVELQKFIKDRTRKDAMGDAVDCIYQLRQLDSKATFRFMDLHPELRLETYDHLLTYGPCGAVVGRGMNPNILATCKEVNREGQKLLHKNMKTTLIIRCTVHDPNCDEGGSTVRIGSAAPEKLCTTLSPASEKHMDSPIFDPEQTSVLVFIRTPESDRGFFDHVAVDHFCYQLATKLHNSHFTTLEVRVKLPKLDPKQDSPYKSLSRVDSNIEMSVRGLPDAWSEEIKHMRMVLGDGTAWNAWKEVEKACKDLINRVKSAGIDKGTGVDYLPGMLRQTLAKFVDGRVTMEKNEWDQCMRVQAAKDALCTGKWKELDDKATKILADREAAVGSAG